MVLLQGPTGWRFLMSEVPLYLLLDARDRALLLALQALQHLRPVHISFLRGGIGTLSITQL